MGNFGILRTGGYEKQTHQRLVCAFNMDDKRIQPKWLRGSSGFQTKHYSIIKYKIKSRKYQ